MDSKQFEFFEEGVKELYSKLEENKYYSSLIHEFVMIFNLNNLKIKQLLSVMKKFNKDNNFEEFKVEIENIVIY